MSRLNIVPRIQRLANGYRYGAPYHGAANVAVSVILDMRETAPTRWHQHLDLLRQVEPHVEFPPAGQSLESACRLRDEDIHSWEDFYRFVDRELLGVFSLAEFLRHKDADRAIAEAVTRAERQREEKARIDAVIARKREEVGDENAEIPVREIAEETGIPKSTVHDRLSGKSLGNENSDKPKPTAARVEARRVYLPMDAQEAASRLVAKFGRDFSRAVAGAVLSME